MKLFIFVALIVWGICGFAGAWMLDSSDIRWKAVARGPITLVKAFRETPVPYPSV